MTTRRNKHKSKHKSKHNTKHKCNRKYKIHTRKRKQKAGISTGVYKFTHAVGKGYGFGGTGYDKMGNIFKQISKKLLVI